MSSMSDSGCEHRLLGTTPRKVEEAEYMSTSIRKLKLTQITILSDSTVMKRDAGRCSAILSTCE